MKQYLDLMRHVIEHGVPKNDRTGTGTLSTFGYQMRFNMSDGFPLLTTKQIHWKSVLYELLWFLRGSSNIAYLKENGVSIWDEWADAKGDLGPVYGVQWREWPGMYQNHDQFSNLIHSLLTNPDSRRHIVSAWNVDSLNKMALPPCHMMFQCYVSNGRLSLQMYQRSADVFLGVPFNIASYALLLHILAKVCDYIPHELIISIGDAHIYSNHMDQVALQLTRTPYPLPILALSSRIGYGYHMNAWDETDFILTHYTYHPSIKAPIAV